MPAQCLRGAIFAAVRCDPNPARATSARTSVSSHTSHSWARSNSRWCGLQRPARFQVPTRICPYCPFKAGNPTKTGQRAPSAAYEDDEAALSLPRRPATLVALRRRCSRGHMASSGPGRAWVQPWPGKCTREGLLRDGVLAGVQFDGRLLGLVRYPWWYQENLGRLSNVRHPVRRTSEGKESS